MADTTYAYTPGSGGFASIDRISTTDYPHYKVKWGPAGTVNDADIASGKPFPIQLRGSDGTDRSNLLPVSIAGTPAVAQSGTWNIGTIASLPAVVQGAGGASAWKVDGSGVTQPVSGTVTVNGVPTTALTRGGGAADGNTLRVTQDTSQLGTLVKSSVPVITGGYLYQVIPASTGTAVILGTTGAIGDYLEHLVAVVTDTTTSHVDIQDGVGPAIHIFPNDVAGGKGTYHVALGILSTGVGWRVSTGAGVEVLATGRWT